MPREVQKKLRATTKSIRNYEVVACINVGKQITVALAVVEEGVATYTVGTLRHPELVPFFSKFDLVMGSHLKEYDAIRTETLLEEMERSGIEVFKETPPDYSTRYYSKELTLNIPTKVQITTQTLREYLQARGFTVVRNENNLHVRHLERMRHRTGYIIPKD